ncbi:hypothetical protein BG011_006754 [Mortierella polycephala]|uniref:Nicastrin n=1 Tax=Mortierella polycephala TaxID=41804 RepID=A0A9P6QFJ4_9FUNG|nr:hypothetical protein BG011_006754 [Mortierella polycephala]
MGAASGVIYQTDNLDDIQQFASNRELRDIYTIIMPYWLLTASNVQLLRSSNKLGAIITVVNGTGLSYTPAARPTDIVSPDSTCPNCEFGLYANSPDQYQWNPTGTGLIYEQFDFPIYALNTMDTRNTMSYNAVIQAVNINKFKRYQDYPLKALQFNSFMWAAQDTASCLRKDTMSKHIIYTLFTAEAWGFSGSQRFVKDISDKIECIKPAEGGPGCVFPFYSDFAFQRIDPTKIEAILEAGQVGGIGQATDENPSLYAHIDNRQAATSAALLRQVVQAGGNASNPTALPNPAIPVQAANSDDVQRGLPPSSAMSFLKARGDIPTVVLTAYQKQMSPLTSHDLDDTWDPISTVNSIQQAASVISKTAWMQAQGISDATLMTPEQQQAMGSIQVDRQAEDNSYYILDASKPVWTESTWDPVGLRLFDVISPTAQYVELATGIVLTVVSIGAVWYARRFLRKTLKED